MLFKKNIKLLIVLVICTYLSIHCVNAQMYIGIEGGYTNNFLNTSVMNRSYTRHVNLGGYNVGVFCKRSVSKVFAVRAGIELMQKNYSFERTEKYKGIYENYYNTYCQLPVTLQIDVFKRKKVNLAFNTGVFGAYWVSSKLKGTIPNVFNTTNEMDTDGQSIQNFKITDYFENYSFEKRIDNRLEFGLLAGVNFLFNLNDKKGIFVEYNYYWSLTDMQKKYMINQAPKKNQSSAFAFGFLLKLKDKTLNQ